MYSGFLNEQTVPNAASEKDLGNEYFKQKKFHEAIDCYSRSIALSPTSVAFANRAMAHLKLRRFEEAQDDCTEALNLDDRYVKAYSRRATARKELGKLKEAMEDSEFAMRLEPNNQELRKQYYEMEALYLKGRNDKVGDPPLRSVNNTEKSLKAVEEIRENILAGPKGGSSFRDASMKENQGASRRLELKTSTQDLASRAASRFMASSVKNISAPKSAYEFEVSWRALSDDCQQQAQLLKTIPPATLPQVFKNALSASMLIDIIKCTATLFKDDAELSVSILDNMVKVPRFDMIVMCLSPLHRSELRRIWEEVFSAGDIAAHRIETLKRLRKKYIHDGWQDDMLISN